jgi:hypothetical protein
LRVSDPDSEPRGEAPLHRRHPLLLAAAILFAGVAVAVAVALVLSGGSNDGTSQEQRIAELPGSDADPFTFESSRRDDFIDRATSGYSHVLYDKSPGGIFASARRTARWRPLIERAAAAHGTDPDVMEAMVLLESAGRPDVIAGTEPSVASGLAQIVASTGTDFLDMKIDLQRSKAITRRLGEIARQIERAKKDAASPKPKVRSPALLKLRKLTREQAALIRERRNVDARFRPAAALDGMARYLELAGRRFGDPGLATESYHMGIGNLESAVGLYLGTDASGGAVGGLVAEDDIDYARLFFGSSPLEHAEAWDLLSSLGDDSSTYLWRVLAAKRVMALYRDDPAELKRLAALQTAKSTQEEVFHPESDTVAFATPDEIRSALADGSLEALPRGEDLGFRVDKRMGELAPNLGVRPGLYRALRPQALATLVYMAALVREINNGKGTLSVTSTVRDEGYQRQLLGINDQATPNYSLHTTGYSFDVARDYSSDRQAEAFQFALDRLRALNVIDYAVEPEAIHVTVSDDAQPLLDATN